jgi:hypothetical protein
LSGKNKEAIIGAGDFMNNEDINRYLSAVYKEAVRVKSRLSYNIELDDLISTGIFALLDWLIIYGSESDQLRYLELTSGRKKGGLGR